MWKEPTLRRLRQGLVFNGRMLPTRHVFVFGYTGHALVESSWPKSLKQSQRFLSSSKQPRGRDSRNKRHESRRKEGGSVPAKIDKQVLADAMKEIQSLQHAAHALEPLPPVWFEKGPLSQPVAATRAQIFAGSQALVEQLETAIRQKVLRPSDKHGREISFLLRDILQLYTESVAHPIQQPGVDTSTTLVYDAYNRVVDLMKRCNLERQQAHYQYGVEIAVREGQYAAAAEICWRQIDPTDGYGYAPCDVSVAEPVGLYALARAAQEQKGTPVVESVMDGVLKMSMVSPQDQEKYILAAGTALGHAEEWEAFISYLKTSYRAIQLGQPLVAAVMHASIICGQYESALQVFDNFVSSQPVGASEWQWGGGQDRLHPLCRDLAMRALGETGALERALQFYRDAQADNVCVSVEAVRGVVRACEREGHWEDAVLVWFSLLNEKNLRRLVSGDDLVVSDVEPSASETLSRISELSAVLDPVMRACNAGGHFGVGMLCLHLLELVMQGVIELDPNGSGADASMGPLSLLNQPRELLRTVMVSLCGLESHHHATDLYHKMNGMDAVSEYLEHYHAADIGLTAGVEQMKFGGLFPPWEGASRQLRRILFAFDAIEKTSEQLTDEDVRHLSSALAAAVRCCVAASQPETGIYLAHWVEMRDINAPSTQAETVLFRGTPQVSVAPTDALVSAAIEAFHDAGKSDIALELIECYIDLDEPSSAWTLSNNEAIKVFLDLERSSEAMTLFRKVLSSNKNQDTFGVMARGLADSNQWKGVADIYRLALISGFVSEDLSLLAMKAVVSGRLDGKFRVLRNIIGEIAAVVGTNSLAWTESKYWMLKRLIGFSNARNLMFWEDPHTSHLDELELALGDIEARIARGQAPKTDTLRLVASAACSFHEGYVPADRTGLPRVPRTRNEWEEILATVSAQATNSALFDDPSFIHSISFAHAKLQNKDEARQLVKDAVARGVRVQQKTLRSVVNDTSPSDDLRLLLVDQP